MRAKSTCDTIRMHEAIFASDRDICVISSGSSVVNISATDYSPCVESLIPMASDTQSDHGLRGSTIVVAVVVPAVFVTIVLSLIVTYGARAGFADS
jgi:hypothetical protein